MTPKDFQKYFSPARATRYLAATNNATKAVLLYKANLEVAKSFHPLLGVAEVIIRNCIDRILTAYFADPDWIINQKNGFMSDPSLVYIQKKTGKKIKNDFLKKEVEKAEKRLQRTGAVVSGGKIIAEQTFGFWTDLFEVHHYKLLSGKPIQIFSLLPSGYGRKEVNDELDKIRRFRNRINHNEPICFTGNTIDFTLSKEVYNSIINILTWIDPALLTFINDIDNMQGTIMIAENI